MQRLTRHQIKAGRDLLGLSQQQLCDAAGMSLITLRRLEGRSGHQGLVSDATIFKLRSVMEELGIQFLETGDQALGEGVALRGDRQ